MKFLILVPFLLAPALSQFNFVNEIAQTVKHTAEEGAKAVENVAVDGAHTVQKIGEQLIHDAGNVANSIGQTGKDIGHSVEKLFNPQQPQPQSTPVPVPEISPEPILIPDQPKAPQVPSEKESQKGQQHLQKQEGQLDSASSNSSSSGSRQQSEKPQRRQHQSGSRQGLKPHEKNKRPQGVDPKMIQEMQKCRKQMHEAINQFKALKEQYEKQGKQLTRSDLEAHKAELKEIKEKMNQLRMNAKIRPKLDQNNDASLDIDEERIILREKLRQSNDMTPQERQKFKEQMIQKFEAKMEAKEFGQPGRVGGNRRSKRHGPGGKKPYQQRPERNQPQRRSEQQRSDKQESQENGNSGYQSFQNKRPEQKQNREQHGQYQSQRRRPERGSHEKSRGKEQSQKRRPDNVQQRKGEDRNHQRPERPEVSERHDRPQRSERQKRPRIEEQEDFTFSRQEKVIDIDENVEDNQEDKLVIFN